MVQAPPTRVRLSNTSTRLFARARYAAQATTALPSFAASGSDLADHFFHLGKVLVVQCGRILLGHAVLGLLGVLVLTHTDAHEEACDGEKNAKRD